MALAQIAILQNPHHEPTAVSHRDFAPNYPNGIAFLYL
jgi:hypothetical protein